jgi:hypothetical protein
LEDKGEETKIRGKGKICGLKKDHYGGTADEKRTGV